MTQLLKPTLDELRAFESDLRRDGQEELSRYINDVARRVS